MSKLDQLRSMTVVVADTGDIEAVRRMRPEDCTTNPSLVLKALQDPGKAEAIERAVREGREAGAARIITALTVGLGVELAGIVPGRVSTEVDARLSFDAEGSVRRAHEILEAYAAKGIGRERILIKLASTWEGVRACERLQREGVDCNMTLLFSMAQARAAADAGAFLISPFVGRITDWWSKKEGGKAYAPDEDPGVLSVRRIYEHYKSHGIGTVVMGASFRNIGQIEALAGCDRLTISPELLQKLDEDGGDLPRRLSPGAAGDRAEPIAEAGFRWEMNEDAMATEKLAEGIRNFHADAARLERMVAERLAA